jgi:hypothetical protein
MKKAAYLSVIVLLVLVITAIVGCGGGGGGTTGGSSEDTAAPTVISYSPTGSSVQINSAVAITFSEYMNQASSEGAFSISPSVSGAFTWSGSTMTFTPTTSLASTTTYQVSVATSACDTAGNHLGQATNFSFTTETIIPGQVDIHALFIGINDYPDYSDNDLNYCVADANGMVTSLANSPSWANRCNIITLTDRNATKTAIQNAISSIKAAADPTDKFVFMFSGHGSNSNGHASICVWENNDWGYINETELQTWLSGMPCPTTLIFDSCHSGGLIGKDNKGPNKIKCYPGAPGYDHKFNGIMSLNPNIKGLEALNNIVCLTACTYAETSQESSSLQHGVFIYYVLQGLGNGSTIGPADADGSGYITSEETYNYSNPRATAYNSGQHPQLQDNYPTVADPSGALQLKY